MNPGAIPEAVVADRLATLVPQATYAAVADSVHFSFLPECKEGGAAFLESLGEVDPICEDTGRPRADIHAELKERIVGTLRRNLKASSF